MLLMRHREVMELIHGHRVQDWDLNSVDSSLQTLAYHLTLLSILSISLFKTLNCPLTQCKKEDSCHSQEGPITAPCPCRGLFALSLATAPCSPPALSSGCYDEDTPVSPCSRAFALMMSSLWSVLPADS